MIAIDKKKFVRNTMKSVVTFLAPSFGQICPEKSFTSFKMGLSGSKGLNFRPLLDGEKDLSCTHVPLVHPT